MAAGVNRNNLYILIIIFTPLLYRARGGKIVSARHHHCYFCRPPRVDFDNNNTRVTHPFALAAV